MFIVLSMRALRADPPGRTDHRLRWHFALLEEYPLRASALRPLSTLQGSALVEKILFF